MTTILLLIAIGAALIILNFRAIKKDKNSFSRVLNDREENMQNFEVEIGKFRREFSETILELQQEIESLKDRLNEKNNEGVKENYAINKEQVEDLQNLINDIKMLTKDKMVKSVEEKVVEEIKEDIKDDIKVKIDEKFDGNFDEKYKENLKEEDKDNVSNTNEIHELIDKGLSVDEIAEKTGIGKGEVLLIKDLYKK